MSVMFQYRIAGDSLSNVGRNFLAVLFRLTQVIPMQSRCQGPRGIRFYPKEAPSMGDVSRYEGLPGRQELTSL